MLREPQTHPGGGGAVDVFFEPMARYHVAVVDEDCPDLYQNEHGHIEVLLHGADKNEDTKVKLLEKQIIIGPGWLGNGGNLLVWQRLNVSVERVEGESSPWSRH